MLLGHLILRNEQLYVPLDNRVVDDREDEDYPDWEHHQVSSFLGRVAEHFAVKEPGCYYKSGVDEVAGHDEVRIHEDDENSVHGEEGSDEELGVHDVYGVEAAVGVVDGHEAVDGPEDVDHGG